MLPDAVRARIAELLQIIAKARATVGLCNRRGEVEVCIGAVAPYLAGLERRGSFLMTRAGKPVWVDQIDSEFRLVCIPDSEDQVGDVIGASHSIKRALESALSGGSPEPPASSAASR